MRANHDNPVSRVRAATMNSEGPYASTRSQAPLQVLVMLQVHVELTPLAVFDAEAPT